MNEIQTKIAELQEKKWTLAAIADEIEVTVNAVEKWKAGDAQPRNAKAVIMLLDMLLEKKRIPKQRRYVPDSRQNKSVDRREEFDKGKRCDGRLRKLLVHISTL